MKRKIQLELLATSALAIVLTLLFALYVFYGLFKKQVINDLREDSLALFYTILPQMQAQRRVKYATGKRIRYFLLDARG
ncbi:MAG: hypothetical protein II280_06550, partial [Lachnospiraceae bacterium]|nr:hypothetical protein [Lachnospiraceae bacterium]